MNGAFIQNHSDNYIWYMIVINFFVFKILLTVSPRSIEDEDEDESLSSDRNFYSDEETSSIAGYNYILFYTSHT